MINPRKMRRLGRPADEPTASVTVTLEADKEMSPQIVEGFAKLVSGAVAGLKPHDVNVIDKRTGRSYNTKHPDEIGPSDYLEAVRGREAYLYQKILKKLADIPGVLIAVSVELDPTRHIKQTNTYAEPQEKTSTTQESSQAAAERPTEAGVQPNTGVALTAGPAGQTSSTEESTSEMFPPTLAGTETIEQPPFAQTGVTATVSIPRSFLVGVFSAKYPDDGDPKDDDPRFTDIQNAQVSGVKKAVKLIVQADSPDDVDVDVYPDMRWSQDGGAWNAVPGQVPSDQESVGIVGVLEMVRGYGPQVGLGALALMSLLMMTRIVRRSSQIALMQTKRREAEESVDQEGLLTVGPRPVGEAEVSTGMLTGKEVDEQTLRYQELGEEVSKMVDADPAGAAELVRRWVEDVD
jgi:flagellar biosynthesis/type III secretory pathway M-ring protein FliF/YscJ